MNKWLEKYSNGVILPHYGVKQYKEGGVTSPQICYDPKTGKVVPCKPGAHKTWIFTENPTITESYREKSYSVNAIKNNEFTKEAEDLKNYLIKNQPGEDIEIYPTYKSGEINSRETTTNRGKTLNEILRGSDAKTRLAFMAHHGNNLFGNPAHKLGKKLQATTYDNCYLGSCYSGDIAASDEFKGLSNFHFRPGYVSMNISPDNKEGLPWFGVNPNKNSQTGEAGVNNAFFNTTYDIDTLNNLYKQVRSADDKLMDLFKKNNNSNSKIPIDDKRNPFYKDYKSLSAQLDNLQSKQRTAQKVFVGNPKKGREYDILNLTNGPHIRTDLRFKPTFFGDDYFDDTPLDNPQLRFRYQMGGSLPKAQDGWVQRAANAEFSCAANPRSNLNQSYSEYCNPKKGLDKDEYKALKNELSSGSMKDLLNVEEYYVLKNLADNQNRKMGREDNAYSKYFDPSTGLVLSNLTTDLREEGNLRATNRMYPGRKNLLVNDVYQGILKDYNITTPQTPAQTKALLEKAYNIGYAIPKQQDGGSLPKAQKGKTLPPILTDDPRKVKNYNDSMHLYNEGMETEKFFRDHGFTNNVTHEFPFSQVTSYGYANKPKDKIQPISAVSQEKNPYHPSYYKADWVKYKKAVQPYILQKEPSLKKKVTKAELLKSDRTAFNPQITQLQNQSINLPTIQNLPYRVEYYDGDINGMTHKNFIDEKAGSEFMKELQNRSYGIPYGVQAYYENTPKKENGGWLEKYQGGGEEPLTKSSADWYKQWYEQRQALPQFSRVAGERLKLLSTLPKVQLSPLEELHKFGAVGEYIKNRGDDASQDIINLADPATVPAFAKKEGKSIDVNIGTDPSVVGHEMSHWFDARAKQYMFKPRDSKSEPYEKYPFIKPTKFKKSGLDGKTYSWISDDDNPEFATGVKTEVNSVLNELRQKEGLRGDQSTTPEQLQKIIDKYMNLSEDELRGGSPKGSQNQRIRTLIKYMGGDPKKLSELNNTIVTIQKEDVPIAKHGGWLSKYDEGGEISPNCDTNALYHPITNPCGYKVKLTPGLLENTTQQITQPYNSSNFREQPLANSNSYIQQQQLQRFNNTKRVEDNKLKNKILNQPQLKQAKEETPYERERRTALNSSYVGSNQYAALDDNGNITNRFAGRDITGKVYDSKAVRQERMKPFIAAGAIAAGATGLPAVVSAAAPYVAATSAALNAPLLGTLGAEYGTGALTAQNLIGLGFGMKGASNLGSDINSGYYNSDAPLLEKIERGLITGMDIAFSPGVFKGLGMGYGATKNAYNTVATGESALPIASSVDDVGKGLTQAPKPAWQMQEMPGLHLQSTMEGEAISKIVDKTGKINTEQALAIIAKESGGADKVALIKQGLGETIPKKIDFNEFRKITQDQLIPLERQFSSAKSDYGIDRIGYNYGSVEENIGGTFNVYGNPTKFKTREEAEKFLKLNRPIENQTLILGNKSKFGRGSGAHGNPDETLGHAHFLRDAETPDVLTVTQIQSDAFQGTHRSMPKNIDDAISRVNKEKQHLKENIEIFGDEPEKFKDLLSTLDRHLVLEESQLKNFTQKQLLDKNHPERYLQELVDYAGKRGDVNKVRVPTSETAAKVQGYVAKKTWNVKVLENGDEVVLADGTVGKVTDVLFDNYVVVTANDGKKINIDFTDAGYGKSKTPSVKSVNNIDVKESAVFMPAHQTILKKYSEQPKTIKKLFGEEPKIVTDSKGNTWYEFGIPETFKQGKGQIRAFKQGGIIKDDRGQWDHPGKITRIKGGNITMKPDPKTGKALTEPLLGISNTGERKMMYPGQDYQFEDDTEYVTEYPIAKNGVRQEQKGLQNLDDLLNFTNYNKPQPDRWLNKYN